ncbi:unnamed protein product [Brassicogethes aeneus]|uniref:DUF4806 domain-containing protein n=1 Tax=Brassicogethes aeneus TaxID=1431903 RepID=A0A9P0B9V3_BRAAE|nr:unnamed protein product [Brassicogethes aeneus]
MEKQWKVVQFNNEEEGQSIEVVPSRWINGTDCFWPPFDNRKDVESAIKHCLSPQEGTWRKYTNVVSKTRSYGKFATASARANKVVALSDIDNSESEKLPAKRTVKKNLIYANYSLNANDTSEEESGINPQIPKFPMLLKNKKIGVEKKTEQANNSVGGANNLNINNQIFDSPSSKKIDSTKSKAQKSNTQQCDSQISNSQKFDDPKYQSQKFNSQVTTDFTQLKRATHKTVVEAEDRDEDYLDLLPSDDNNDSDAHYVSDHNSDIEVEPVLNVANKTFVGELHNNEAAAILETDQLGDNNNIVLKKLVRQTILNNRLIKEQNYMLKELISKLNAVGLKNMDPDEEQFLQQFKNTFPILEDDVLRNTNQLLYEDDKFYKYAVKMVSLEGGHTISECVRKAMKTILDDNLANSYSFKGHKAKKNFTAHKHFVTLIIDCVRNHVPQATTKEIEDQMAVWLTKAKRRMEALQQ